MSSTKINNITLLEGTRSPVVHELVNGVIQQMMLYDVQIFASAAERTAAYAFYNITASKGTKLTLRFSSAK